MARTKQTARASIGWKSPASTSADASQQQQQEQQPEQEIDLCSAEVVLPPAVKKDEEEIIDLCSVEGEEKEKEEEEEEEERIPQLDHKDKKKLLCIFGETAKNLYQICKKNERIREVVEGLINPFMKTYGDVEFFFKALSAPPKRNLHGYEITFPKSLETLSVIYPYESAPVHSFLNFQENQTYNKLWMEELAQRFGRQRLILLLQTSRGRSYGSKMCEPASILHLKAAFSVKNPILWAFCNQVLELCNSMVTVLNLGMYYRDSKENDAHCEDPCFSVFDWKDLETHTRGVLAQTSTKEKTREEKDKKQLLLLQRKEKEIFRARTKTPIVEKKHLRSHISKKSEVLTKKEKEKATGKKKSEKRKTPSSSSSSTSPFTMNWSLVASQKKEAKKQKQKQNLVHGSQIDYGAQIETF